MRSKLFNIFGLLILFLCYLSLFVFALKQDLIGAQETMAEEYKNPKKGFDASLINQIYRNEKYGYELKYQSDWEAIEAKPRVGYKVEWTGNILVDDELQKVTFLEKESVDWQGEFQIAVISNPDKLNLEQWIKKNEPQTVMGSSLIREISETTLNGKPAKRLSIFGFDHERIEVISLYKGYIYRIGFAWDNPNDTEVERHKQIYNQMFLSFRFIGQ